MEEVINYGWLSLIPAVVAVVLAFATRNVVLSWQSACSSAS